MTPLGELGRESCTCGAFRPSQHAVTSDVYELLQMAFDRLFVELIIMLFEASE